MMRLLTCYRCLYVNEESELRESVKIKGLTVEQSRKFKMCAKCKCRTFITGGNNANNTI